MMQLSKNSQIIFLKLGWPLSPGPYAEYALMMFRAVLPSLFLDRRKLYLITACFMKSYSESLIVPRAIKWRKVFPSPSGIMGSDPSLTNYSKVF